MVSFSTIKDSQEYFSQESCAICLEEFNDLDNVVARACKHIFHEECNDFWKKQSPTCAICRNKDGPSTEEDEIVPSATDRFLQRLAERRDLCRYNQGCILGLTSPLMTPKGSASLNNLLKTLSSYSSPQLTIATVGVLSGLYIGSKLGELFDKFVLKGDSSPLISGYCTGFFACTGAAITGVAALTVANSI